MFYWSFQTHENWWKHKAIDYYFWVFGNPDEIQSMSFWNCFSIVYHYPRTMKKFSLILVLFFSNYWPLLSNILAVSQVPEDRHCLKQNTYTSLDLNSVILNEVWHCHLFGKPKQPMKRLIWFKKWYPSPLSTKINGLKEYLKIGKGSIW